MLKVPEKQIRLYKKLKFLFFTVGHAKHDELMQWYKNREKFLRWYITVTPTNRAQKALQKAMRNSAASITRTHHVPKHEMTAWVVDFEATRKRLERNQKRNIKIRKGHKNV